MSKKKSKGTFPAIHITTETLKSWNACASAIKGFGKTFPDGIHIKANDWKALYQVIGEAERALINWQTAVRNLKLTLSIKVPVYSWGNELKMHKNGKIVARGYRYVNGQLHDDKRPAYISAYGTQVFYKHGLWVKDHPKIKLIFM